MTDASIILAFKVEVPSVKDLSVFVHISLKSGFATLLRKIFIWYGMDDFCLAVSVKTILKNVVSTKLFMFA